MNCHDAILQVDIFHGRGGVNGGYTALTGWQGTGRSVSSPGRSADRTDTAHRSHTYIYTHGKSSTMGWWPEGGQLEATVWPWRGQSILIRQDLPRDRSSPTIELWLFRKTSFGRWSSRI